MVGAIKAIVQIIWLLWTTFWARITGKGDPGNFT
jgi:hypothetical protein